MSVNINIYASIQYKHMGMRPLQQRQRFLSISQPLCTIAPRNTAFRTKSGGFPQFSFPLCYSVAAEAFNNCERVWHRFSVLDQFSVLYFIVSSNKNIHNHRQKFTNRNKQLKNRKKTESNVDCSRGYPLIARIVKTNSMK